MNRGSNGWNNEGCLFFVAGRFETPAGGGGSGPRAEDHREAKSRGCRCQQGSEEGKHIRLVCVDCLRSDLIDYSVAAILKEVAFKMETERLFPSRILENYGLLRYSASSATSINRKSLLFVASCVEPIFGIRAFYVDQLWRTIVSVAPYTERTILLKDLKF